MSKPTNSDLRTALTHYSTSLQLKANAMPRTSAELPTLDAWFRTDLRETLKKREQKGGGAYLIADELKEVMKWKLARGKWRPRLLELVQSNSESLIKSTTLTAFSLPTSIEALKQLSTLKGVGPATASAILSLHYPTTEPFLSDEAFDLLSIGKAEYTVKGWEKFREGMKTKLVKEKWEDDGMEKLEMAMWSWRVREKWGSHEDEKMSGEPVEKKRKVEAEGAKSDVSEVGKRKSRKVA